MDPLLFAGHRKASLTCMACFLHCSGGYDFRSMTPIAGRCIEDGGSGGRDPNLQLTSQLLHLADSGELQVGGAMGLMGSCTNTFACRG